MTRKFIRYLAAALLLGVGGLAPAAGPADGFVRVKGTGFELAGRPYRFAGVNLWYAAYLGSPGRYGDRSRLVRELDQLQQLGVTNVRILGASEPTPYSPLTPVFQPKPGVYNEELLQGLDYALDQIGRHGMKAVIFLHNQWEWSGGMATYVGWATGTERPRSDKWPDTLIYDTRFYGLPEARSWHRAYVRMLVNRTNTITGRPYSADPAIMAWELSNEPRVSPDAADAAQVAALLYWIGETSRLIRSLAPEQLITTGSEGLIATNNSAEIYQQEHAPVSVDYFTLHIWPSNWGWYIPAQSAETFPTVLTRTREYLARHVEVASRLGKPLVLEEFGLQRDGALFLPGTPTTTRDAYLQDIFGQFLANVRAGSPFAGLNVWTWSGEGVPVAAAGAFWKEGTPFTGDNGIEKQGLNSIYGTDASTLALLRELNRELTQPPKH